MLLLLCCRAQTEICQSLFNDLHAAGNIAEQTMEQLYSEAAGKFLADRFVVGTCPKCKYEVRQYSNDMYCRQTAVQSWSSQQYTCLSGEEGSCVDWFMVAHASITYAFLVVCAGHAAAATSWFVQTSNHAALLCRTRVVTSVTSVAA